MEYATRWATYTERMTHSSEKKMITCNRGSTNACATPRKIPFTPTQFEEVPSSSRPSSSTRTVTGGLDPRGEEETPDISMFRQEESESDGERVDDDKAEETDEEMDAIREQELIEIEMRYEQHHVAEYVTHLQVAYGFADPYDEKESHDEVRKTFLEICTGARMEHGIIVAGLENVKKNDQKWRAAFAQEVDLGIKEERLKRDKIARCKRERILPEHEGGGYRFNARPNNVSLDDYIFKIDKERLIQLEVELWDMHHRQAEDPKSDDAAERKKSYFRNCFLREVVADHDTSFTQGELCTQQREEDFKKEEDEAAQHASASSSSTTAVEMEIRQGIFDDPWIREENTEAEGSTEAEGRSPEPVNDPAPQAEKEKAELQAKFRWAEKSIRAAVGDAGRSAWSSHFSMSFQKFPTRVFTPHVLDGCVAFYKWRCYDKEYAPTIKKFFLARDTATAENQRDYDKLPVIIWHNKEDTSPDRCGAEQKWMHKADYVKDTYMCYDEDAPLSRRWKLDGQREELSTYNVATGQRKFQWAVVVYYRRPRRQHSVYNMSLHGIGDPEREDDEDATEDADAIITTAGEDREEEQPQPRARDHICRNDPEWQQELTDAISRCLERTQQEIIMCCRGKRHAIRNASIIGALLRHHVDLNRRGVHIATTGIDIETDDESTMTANPRLEDMSEYMIYVGRYGGWVITEESTGNVVERFTDSADRLTRWRCLAFTLAERNRAWPRLERLQFQIRAQIQQGRDTLCAEEVREIYRTENYNDFVWYNGQEEEQRNEAADNATDELHGSGRTTEDVNIDMTSHDGDTTSEATEASVDDSVATM